MTNNVSTINPTYAGSIGGFASVHETDKVSFPKSMKSIGKEVCSKLCIVYMQMVHKITLCSVLLFSLIISFELPVCVTSLVVLAVIAICSSLTSFFSIYNKVIEEEE